MSFGKACRSIACLMATAGGLGDLPVAPGTWGSLLGLWVGDMVVHVMPSVFGRIGLVLVGVVLSSLICTWAERAFGTHDPSRIVLDEVWGMMCVLLLFPWSGTSLATLLLSFLLFRAFDIVKPPPLKQLETFPEGWGIVADDLGASMYTIAVLALVRLTLNG